jgi:hypothetical protein
VAKRPSKTLIPTPLDQISEALEEFVKFSSSLSGRAASAARKELAKGIEAMRAAMISLDPVRQPSNVFNPGNPRTVGLFTSIALLAQEREPLGEVAPYYGSGVYAIYYKGDYAAYKPLVRTEHPIYVGKADPAIADAKTYEEMGDRLARRVRDHAKAIRRADNLAIEDFMCRQLVVASGIQTAAENYLINLFKPIWNKETKIAYGIGKHGDDPDTRGNKRSPWDTLHQGRSWAHRDSKMEDQASEAQIVAKITDHFGKHPPFKNIDAVLHQFYEDLRQR